MSSSVQLLERLNEAGAVLWIEGDRLHVRAPVGVLTDEYREALRAHKPDLVSALLSDPVGWRVAAMRRQLAAWSENSIPFLVARPHAATDGNCLSCGEPLQAPWRFRCRECADAAERVLMTLLPEWQPRKR